jgi:hypothetical protein
LSTPPPRKFGDGNTGGRAFKKRGIWMLGGREREGGGERGSKKIEAADRGEEKKTGENGARAKRGKITF